MEDRSGDKTYSVRDVEQFLNNIRQNYETRMQINEDTILNLKSQNHELQNILKKHMENEQQLSMALRNAEQKFRNVETSLRNMYDLKTKQLSIIYSKLEKNLGDLRRRYGIPEEEITRLTADVRLTLSLAEAQSNSNNYVERQPQNAEPTVEVVISNDIGYRVSHNNHKSVINKSIEDRLFENFSADNSSSESTAEQFLSEKIDSASSLKCLGKNRMNNIIPRHLSVEPKKTDGFSLEEALVPSQSLEEIMLAFDIDFDDKN